MKQVQGSTTDPGGMLPGESHRAVKRFPQRDGKPAKLSPGNVKVHGSLGGIGLLVFGFTPENLQLQGSADFKFMEDGVDQRLPSRDSGNRRAIRLGVIKFDQATGIEIQHVSAAGMHDQMAEGFAGRVFPPDPFGAGKKIGFFPDVRRRGGSAALFQPSDEAVHLGRGKALDGILDFRERAHFDKLPPPGGRVKGCHREVSADGLFAALV